MRLKCIGCEVMARLLYNCASTSPHIVDIQLIRKGLHNTPADLRSLLQDQIDQTSRESYDAIILAYGLCGKAIAGLVAPSIPIVMPRAHDCITLFLGSRQRYNEQFDLHPGTYWYSQDYIERNDGSNTLSMGSGSDTELEAVYDEYVKKYGKDNADYLMQVMGAWQKHYQRAVYIDMGVGNGEEIEARARAEASRRNWTFERLTGDLILLHQLVRGEWDHNFLVVQPGHEVIITYDESVIDCKLTSIRDKGK